MASIQGIYVALFGRPADPLGLAYFDEQTNNGADLTAIGDLSASAEYQERFEGQSNTQIVNSIYNSLFNRDADLAGLAYFVEQLNSGAQDINSIAINILDGAQNDDLVTVNNKIEAADHFTAALDTGTEVVAYQGDDAAQQGRDFLTPVTNDDSTIPSTDDANTYIQAELIDNPSTGEGDTFTLTDDNNTTTGGVDNIQGTSGDDTFRAVTDDALSSVDILHGGGGDDTLNIAAGAIDSANNAPVIDGVEVINNADLDAATGVTAGTLDPDLDLADVTGAEQIWSQFADFTNSNAAYANASLDTTFGGSGSDTSSGNSIDIGLSDSELSGDSTLNLAFADNDGYVGVGWNFGASNQGQGIEHVVIDVAESNSGSTAFTAPTSGTSGLESITINGAGDLDVLFGTGTDLTSLDASAATGNIDFTSDDLTDDYTAMGGSGDNNLDFSAVTDASVDGAISGGAGMDTLIGGAGDDTIDGGAGADTMTGGTGENTFVIDTTSIGVNGQDVITDFGGSGDDSLDFGGPAGSDDNYAEVTTGATDYSSALSAAETALAGDDALQYVAVDTTGGDTYVFYDGDGDHRLDSNGVDASVQLAGVAAGGIDHMDIVG